MLNSLRLKWPALLLSSTTIHPMRLSLAFSIYAIAVVDVQIINPKHYSSGNAATIQYRYSEIYYSNKNVSQFLFILWNGPSASKFSMRCIRMEMSVKCHRDDNLFICQPNNVCPKIVRQKELSIFAYVTKKYSMMVITSFQIRMHHQCVRHIMQHDEVCYASLYSVHAFGYATPPLR